MPFNNFTARPLGSFERHIEDKLLEIVGKNSTATLRIIGSKEKIKAKSISVQRLDSLLKSIQMLDSSRGLRQTNFGQSVQIFTFTLGRNKWTVEQRENTKTLFVQKETMRAEKVS